MWIHGLLHLLGYNHKKLKDYSKMNNKEKKILKNFKLKLINFTKKLFYIIHNSFFNRNNSSLSLPPYDFFF